MQWLSVNNGPNHSVAEMLEPEPKKLDAWSKSQILKYEFQLHSRCSDHRSLRIFKIAQATEEMLSSLIPVPKSWFFRS